MARQGSWTAGARRTARRLQGRIRLRAPRLSVLVVAGAADARELDVSAHAVRALPGADLELVLVAPENSEAAQVAQRHAAEDWRVSALGTDRDGAIPDAVRGRYVITLSAGSVPQRDAIDDALNLLGETGAQLGLGIGPDAAVLSHTVLTNELWKRVDLRQGPAVFLVRAIELAQGRVPLARPIARIQELPAAQGMVDTRPRLAGWLADQTAAWKLIGTGPVAPVWAASVLSGPISAFLADVERLEPGQSGPLRRFVNDLDQALTPADWAEIPVLARVQAWLAARGRHQDLADLVAAQRFENGQFATTAAQGSVTAILPVPADLPADLLLLSAEETPLCARLQRLRWDGSEIEATVFAYVAGIDLLDHQPEVTVTLVGADGHEVPVPCALSADRDVTRWAGHRYLNYDRGAVTIRVPLDALTASDQWRFAVTITVAGVIRTGIVDEIEPGGSAGVFRPRNVGDQHVSLAAGPTLVVRPGAHPERPADQINAIAVDAQYLVLDAADPAGVELVGPGGVLPQDGPGRWSLQQDPWGFGLVPVPSGRYVVRAAGGGGLRWSDAVTDQLPLTVLTAQHRVVLRLEPAAGGHRLVCQVGPPLADDEVGPWCQRQLQADYRAEERPLLHDAVYFQSYTGQSATDSPRAISDELARTGSGLTRYWAVADRSTLVPPGTVPVLWGSRDWYEALARSEHVITNIELERWFSRRPGQQVLQTFHGYPSKAMGIGLWRSKNFTETRIEQQLDRTSRAWTLLLTPAPEMDRHYRENYDYQGPILAAGYPRDDVLRSPQAEQVRAAARARLGLDPGTTAVLYAPTWRDDEASNFRSAKLVDHLDVDAAAEALGPGFVLLLRGHRFMGTRDSGRPTARVLDVSGYPEINDLILAADAAVLDYSSLRFDFALTGKPMIFLVPDLESYATLKRGFLYDFVPTAPGPLLRTSAQVIAALGDLPGVAAAHASDYARFNAAYNQYQDGKAAERTITAFLGGTDLG